jgi:REP element-mobilizing transposase RayT
MAFTPYDPNELVKRHRLRLPHWQQRDRTYFITSRLADSVPTSVRKTWVTQRKAWLSQRGVKSDKDLEKLPEEERNEFHRKFTAKFHDLLDAGQGACWLAKPEIAKVLADLLIEGHGKRYLLDAWVVMPNHFHVLVQPGEGESLGHIVKQWKGASARRIHQMIGSSGSFWQAEAFDHIVRSERQLMHFRRYIAENPQKARLSRGYTVGMGNVVTDFSP